ncbi:histidine kinase [Algoriphagus aestuariicola]|uniref:Histidine kinase n=1 Tax=Algoriphagus aestuariicola TaxID=1852016 RepID=A0ABS3BLE0_9BACT|nr:sensor histidine kinase [Algoriphagus aestuariicola]MBN7800110.1 histidine kinase [Algoriphagus aestuariicola]
MKLRKNFGIEYSLIIAITLISGLVRYSIWDKLEVIGPFPAESILYTFLFLSFTWEFFRGMNAYLNKVIPFTDRFLLRLNTQLVLGVAYMLTINRLLFSLAGKYLEGAMSVMFSLSTNAVFIVLSFLINSIFVGKHFFDEWKKSILRAERLEKEKTQVQFDNLKNQLNPHFLFNSLSSLHSLIFDNPNLASEYVNNLSKVYRYVLKYESQSLVSIREELDFIGHFIFLLKTRFGNAIEIQTDISEGVMDQGIAPVSLQVLLENCIKHNAIDPEHPLKIDIYSKENYLVVRNSRHPKVSVIASNKQGLANLEKLYGFLSTHPVQIKMTDENYTVAIPLISRY